MQRKRKMGYVVRKNVCRQVQLMPGLNLAGRWMERAGFEIGQTVTVSVLNGIITIEQ